MQCLFTKYFIQCSDYFILCTEKSINSTLDSSPDSSPSSADSTPTQGTTLSRRQRKNRREKTTTMVQSKQMEIELPGLQWSRSGRSEKNLALCLLSYCINAADRFALGYPVEFLDAPGYAMIYYHPRGAGAKGFKRPQFDVNAREFIPRGQPSSTYASSDSGSSSGNTSDSEENERQVNNAPLLNLAHHFFMPISGVYPSIVPFELIYESIHSIPKRKQEVYRRACMRCNHTFLINKDDVIVNKEKCVYHTGKLRYRPDLVPDKNEMKALHAWTCCEQKSDSQGCTVFKQHVWSGLNEGFNAPLSSYVKTKHVKAPNKNNGYGVYALDCEMSFTNRGLELTKVSVINTDGKLVYDTFVLPDSPIVDYNTKFSGITAKNLSGKNVKSLREVQNDLMGFINADTILVGHALENDLRALKIIHQKVVDTSVLYPNARGYPHKHSLKLLSQRYLDLEIQTGSNGHNAHEDAWAALQLTFKRVITDFPEDAYS